MKNNKAKRILITLLMVCLLVLPAAAFAADADGDGYDDADVAAVQAIINTSPSLKNGVDIHDPVDWQNKGLALWNGGTPNRVNYLSFQNGIQEIDFTGTLDVSALTALTDIQCNANAGITKLILPKSESLVSVRCYGTSITELDVSGNPNLTHLECYETDITELDVSGNPNLIHLDCENTSISSLDISHLSKLDVLWCNGTNMTSLDVSGNPDLRNLYCSNTDITELDLSKNVILEYLYCDNTKITKLDLSVNQSLIGFNLPGTLKQLVTPEGHRITLTQTKEAEIQLSSRVDGFGKHSYQLDAITLPEYELVRWNGVTEFIDGTTENDQSARFHVTGDMHLSADFQKQERLFLTSLVVEGAALTPAFDRNILSYTAAVPYDVASVNIVAQGMEEYEHSISGAGRHDLNVGENTFVVEVIVPEIPGISDINVPEETLRQEYVVTVTRAVDAGDMPQTGDHSLMGLWTGLMMISLAGAACICARFRKRTN